MSGLSELRVRSAGFPELLRSAHEVQRGYAGIDHTGYTIICSAP